MLNIIRINVNMTKVLLHGGLAVRILKITEIKRLKLRNPRDNYYQHFENAYIISVDNLIIFRSYSLCSPGETFIAILLKCQS